jgi:FKBP-type peptidyl-prolyl cis-trans isomerase FkpA
MEIVKLKSQSDMDELLIQKYIIEKKITAKRTSSGLYYTITKDSDGRRPIPGEKVVVRYNGTFMDGKRFDGNLDSKEPFTFTLGGHNVIAGWDEAIGLLKKGSKATLIIPSELAYGPHASGTIPANAVLLFDVELVDIQKHD